jgi:uncharacterized protein (TIRG00374 family)
MRRSRILPLSASIGAAVLLLVLFFAKANLADVAERLATVRLGGLALAVAASLFSIAVRTWRWQIILRPFRKVSFSPAVTATAVGFAASTVLPLRAGEVVRPAVLARRTDVPFSAALASVVFERVLDMATVLAFFVLYVFWPGIKPPLTGVAAEHFRILEVSAVVAGAALAAFAGIAVWTVRSRAGAERALGRLVAWVPAFARGRLKAGISSFLDGLAILRDGRSFLWVAAGSIFLWLVIDAQIYFLFRAFRLALPFAATFVVLLVTIAGMAIPTPGAVGGFHKACQIALTFFYAVPLDTATGLAIVYHAVAFAPVTIIGFALFALGPGRRRESLASLAEAVREE